MSFESANFTARDFELLAKAMTCTKEPFAIDYKKFAEIAGFKDSNSSKASWHSLKKKVEKVSNGAKLTPTLALADGGFEAPAATPASKKRKTKASDDDIEEAVTPVKKGRKPKVTKAKKDGGDDDEDDEENDVKQEGDDSSAASAVAPTPAKKARKPAATKSKGKKVAAKKDEDVEMGEGSQESQASGQESVE